MPAMLRTFCGSRLKYVNEPVTTRRSPSAPDCASSFARSHCGCERAMNASPITTPVRSRTSSSWRASAAVRPIGFSHSTCLPASAARIDHGTCRWFGSGL